MIYVTPYSVETYLGGIMACFRDPEWTVQCGNCLRVFRERRKGRYGYYVFRCPSCDALNEIEICMNQNGQPKWREINRKLKPSVKAASILDAEIQEPTDIPKMRMLGLKEFDKPE